MNIWVTTIFDTDVWLLLIDVEEVSVNVDRSKVVLVGETRLCCGSDGENVLLLELPAPPLPPPPPPCDAVVEPAAEEGRLELEDGVLDLKRGDDSS